MMAHRGRLSPLLLLVSCGPSASTESTSTTTSTGVAESTSSSTTPTSTEPATALTATTTAPSSTSTSHSSAESTTFPDDDFCSFLCPKDVVPPPCDPFIQDCPDGEKCSPYADGSSTWNNVRCVPLVPNPDLPGESCTVEGNSNSGIDSCALHAICWNVDKDTNIGTCIPMCTGNLDMGICPDSLTCGIFNEGYLPICVPECDPLQQDCSPDEVCIDNPTGEAFLCVHDASDDEGQAFDPCLFANACDPGLACADSTSASECDSDAIGCCLPFCDLTLPPNCPGAMQTCQPYYETDPPQGYENLGLCELPR